MQKDENLNVTNEETPEIEDKKTEVSEDTVVEKTVENPTEEAAVKTQEEETAKQEPQKEEEPVEPPSAHDDFDWSVGNQYQLPYTDDEIEAYTKEYDATLTEISDNEIVNAKVIAVSANDVILDLNYKSNGLLSTSEFRDMPDLKEGDYVEVFIENVEDDNGQLVLSRKKAKLLRAWLDIKESFAEGKIIVGTITNKTKGGLIVDVGGLQTFLPGSQIDIKQIVDYDAYVGKTMEFKVVKINEIIKNAVISHKALIEKDLAEQRDKIIATLEKGQVLEGLVKNITDFGAFMDLGGVDGLLYITDISWGRIKHPSEVLEVNQKINVVVLDFNEDKKRISLGLKQLTPHPWEVLAESYEEGAKINGKIVNIEDYGAFVEVIPGVEGLIHISEVNWSNQPINPRDYFNINQEIEAVIVKIDKEDRKMSLSIKQLTKDPWSDIKDRFAVGSQHTAIVKNLTNYGIFVQLEEGIGGMVHISDLSWTKRYSHPSDFTKVGEKLEVVVLDVDTIDRKISLGHKQIEENPWDTFENVFPEGSYHEATIIKRDDRGGIVQLPYGLEAYAPLKHLRKEDGKVAEIDETLTVKVIEFNRDDKRIIVSHLRYLNDIQREADKSFKEEKVKEKKKTQKSIKKQQSSIKRDTLGDLDMFSKLKQQLKDEEGKKKDEPKAKKAKKEVEKIESTTEEVKEDATIEEVKEDTTTKEVKEDVTTEEVKEDTNTEEVKDDAATEEVKDDKKEE